MRCLLFLLLVLLPPAAAANDLPLDRIKLPPGFAIELFARVDNARGMTLGAENTLFVGSMRAGKVHAVKFDAAYRATHSHLIAEGLQLPVGVAFRDGALYVSAVSRLLRFDGIDVVHYPLTVPVPPLRTRVAVTLHDVQHLDLPGMFPRSERAFRKLAYDRAARRADMVIVPTAFDAQPTATSRVRGESLREKSSRSSVQSSRRMSI